MITMVMHFYLYQLFICQYRYFNVLVTKPVNEKNESAM